MSTALVNVQEQIKQQLQAARQQLPVVTGRTISIRGKVFTLPTGASSQNPIRAIVLDWRNFNRYYTANYNPMKPEPPKCFALAKDIDGMGPHDAAKAKQSDACATCSFNQWGSAPTGKGKACKNNVRLALVTPNPSPDEEPMMLVCPPTSLKSWAAFANNALAQGQLPLQLECEIAFDANQAYPTLLFKEVGEHSVPLEVVFGLQQRAQAMLDAPPIAGGE